MGRLVEGGAKPGSRDVTQAGFLEPGRGRSGGVWAMFSLSWLPLGLGLLLFWGCECRLYCGSPSFAYFYLDEGVE